MTRPPGSLLSALLATTTVLAALLSGCSADEPSPEADPAPADTTTDTATTPARDDARGAIEELLDARAQAILDGRLDVFKAGTVEGAPRRAQLHDLVALQRYPVSSVEYRLGMHDPSVSGDRYRADVEMLVQLEGFDTEPVPTEHRFDFRRTADGWQVERDQVDGSQVGFAPWLLEGGRPYVSKDLVAVFDRDSAVHRERFARIAEAALDTVADHLPVTWSGRAVVLAPSDTDTLRYEGLNPAEIGNLGGVAYPVRGPDQQVTGLRIVIAPVMLDAPDRALSTVLRHEIAHTALIQPHDDAVPVWVNEGLAEYAAHQGDSVLYIDPDAVSAAQEGIDQMPPDGLFHSGDWGPSYGIAWFSMLVLAEKKGVDEPYDLLKAILEEEPADFREVSDLIEDRYDLTTDELAAEAGTLIEATFS